MRMHMDFVLVGSLLKAERDPDAEVLVQVYHAELGWISFCYDGSSLFVSVACNKISDTQRRSIAL